jgi:hypothetical protein
MTVCGVVLLGSLAELSQLVPTGSSISPQPGMSGPAMFVGTAVLTNEIPARLATPHIRFCRDPHSDVADQVGGRLQHISNGTEDCGTPGWLDGCRAMMWHMTVPTGQVFRMTIRDVFTITRRPGLYLAGKIESGVIHIGDRLNLIDGGAVIREVTCDAIEFADGRGLPGGFLVAVQVKSLRPGDASEGQVLAGIQDSE